MTELNTDYNTQAQIIELTEDQLEAVEGGAFPFLALIPAVAHGIYGIHLATTR